jgi:hypothetical protein
MGELCMNNVISQLIQPTKKRRIESQIMIRGSVLFSLSLMKIPKNIKILATCWDRDVDANTNVGYVYGVKFA